MVEKLPKYQTFQEKPSDLSVIPAARKVPLLAPQIPQKPKPFRVSENAMRRNQFISWSTPLLPAQKKFGLVRKLGNWNTR
jgi:hypothetical protein